MSVHNFGPVKLGEELNYSSYWINEEDNSRPGQEIVDGDGDLIAFP